MPIKIINNSDINIKNFCFYFNDDSNDIEETCLLNELIFKEYEITNDKNNDNNEKIIYVPIIPKKKGKILLKILFKFEEDKTYIDHEIQRYLITFNVEDSFNINFKEIINKTQKDLILADLDMVCIANNYNDKILLDNISINEFFYSNDSFELINQNKQMDNINNNENMVINDEHTVIYKKFKIKKNVNEDEQMNDQNYNKKSEYVIRKRKKKLYKKAIELEKKINLEFLNKYDYLYNKNNIEQNHIKFNFCNLLAKNYLIFNWTATEKVSKKEINGILFFKPKLNILITNNIFKNLINNFISINHNLYKMDNNYTICTINVFIDNNFYKQLQNIRGIEIYIDNKDKNNFQKYEWLGLKNYFISNIDNNSDNVDKIHFSCLIKEKGIYDLNKISLAIHYIISRSGVQIFDNILSPIIVKVD